MTTLKKIVRTVLLSSSLVLVSGCSNLDVGFEKESVFHSKVQEEKIKNAVVNVYLDKSVQSTDEFRLVINGEDTEMNLFYNVITRFGIDKKDTKVELFQNNSKIASIDLILEDKKNYFLLIKEGSSFVSMTKTQKSMIDRQVEATPIFISEEAAKAEEVKIIAETKKEAKIVEVELVEKQHIGLDEESASIQSSEKISTSPQGKKHSGYKISKTLQEKYDAGEAIFYYDPDDGE